MSDQLDLKLKNEIKKELIDYYDSIKYELDIKVQQILEQQNFIEKNSIAEQNIYLVNQIDRVLDSNLKDINEYFDNINQDSELFSSNEKNESEMKKDIKKHALKSYLIRVEHKKYGQVYLEFEWYIDENQLNYIQ